METSKPPIALEERKSEASRLSSPSVARNRDAIREVFVKEMPAAGSFLEIGSGTGEHVAHLAAALPTARFLPGDPDVASRASIDAWAAHLSLANIAPAHDFNVAAPDWAAAVTEPLAGVLSINMIHIAPFAAAKGLFGGAGRLLGDGGKLFVYGPFSRNGAHVAPSNAEFDRSLKSRNPEWGVRDLDLDLGPLAVLAGFVLETVVAMPANNLSVIWRKIGAS